MALFRKFESGKKPDLPVKQSYRRSFNAAKVGRLTQDFNPQNVSIDWDLRTSLPSIVARSRHLALNNPYAKKFLNLCSTHIVGPMGFTLHMDVANYNGKEKTTDELANRVIEEHFWKWGKKGNCEVTGKYSFVDIQRILVRGLAREGEFLVRKVTGKGAGIYGYQLQLLDMDRLDVNRNETLPNGNIVKMGVELDKNSRPVAYHLHTNHPGDTVYYTYSGKGYLRIPAEEIIHRFVGDRPEQTRGYPEMAAVMTNLHQLGGYEEAAIVASRAGAAKMGFIQSPTGTAEDLADEETEKGEFLTNVEPGVIDVLPTGYEFKEYNPEYPTAMYDKFVKKTLQGIATGMGVSYNTLANDLEGVSYSSIRTGVLEERDCWTVIQNWFIENFLEEVFTDWLKWALMNAAITTAKGASFPAAKFDYFNSFVWRGRRWAWVDPKSDVEASVVQINNALKSRQDIALEQGMDYDEVIRQLAEEQQKLKDAGVIVTIGQPGQSTTADSKPPQKNN